jgi:hypothetical protein
MPEGEGTAAPVTGIGDDEPKIGDKGGRTEHYYWEVVKSETLPFLIRTAIDDQPVKQCKSKEKAEAAISLYEKNLASAGGGGSKTTQQPQDTGKGETYEDRRADGAQSLRPGFSEEKAELQMSHPVTVGKGNGKPKAEAKSQPDPTPSKLERAEAWLRRYLGNGPMPIPDSYIKNGLCRYNYSPDALPPFGIGKKTIDRAIINLGVQRLPSGPRGGVRWHLPTEEKTTEQAARKLAPAAFEPPAQPSQSS